MKRSLECAEDQTCNGPEDALSTFPEGPPEDHTEAERYPLSEEEADRRWKAEQANMALWNFGGRMRQVQQDWRRLQEEIRASPKRQRTEPCPTYSGPLLLLNQYYWEQGLGASINDIKGGNMFGINMYGSYSSICQTMLRGSSPAANNVAPCNSSSKGDSTIGMQQNNTAAAQAEAPCSGQQQQQQNAAVTEGNGSTPSTPRGSSSNISIIGDVITLPAVADAAAEVATAEAAAAVAADAATTAAAEAAAARPYNLDEIEAVCRQQNLTHLPASRRFVKALKIIRAAKQQQQQQQVGKEQQVLPMVTMV